MDRVTARRAIADGGRGQDGHTGNSAAVIPIDETIVGKAEWWIGLAKRPRGVAHGNTQRGLCNRHLAIDHGKSIVGRAQSALGDRNWITAYGSVGLGRAA